MSRKGHPARSDHPISMKNVYVDKLWILFEDCWDHDPKARPAASEVREMVSEESLVSKVAISELDI
jgi:hypothetical protein